MDAIVSEQPAPSKQPVPSEPQEGNDSVAIASEQPVPSEPQVNEIIVIEDPNVDANETATELAHPFEDTIVSEQPAPSKQPVPPEPQEGNDSVATAFEQPVPFEPQVNEIIVIEDPNVDANETATELAHPFEDVIVYEQSAPSKQPVPSEPQGNDSATIASEQPAPFEPQVNEIIVIEDPNAEANGTATELAHPFENVPSMLPPTPCIGLDSIPVSRKWRMANPTATLLLVTMVSLRLGGEGSLSNLSVYLNREFNINIIDATQIGHKMGGCISFFSLVAAILADSFIGRYRGTTIFLVTSTLHTLRPERCDLTELCKGPSHLQYAVLYTCLTMASIGIGGTHVMILTMGADQFTKPKDRERFFSWYFITTNIASILLTTVFVYVQEYVSWSLGFIVCLIMNVIGLVSFLLGTRFYNDVKATGPFTNLLRVVIASIRKRKVLLANNWSATDFYHGDGVVRNINAVPSNSFRFLNSGALIREGDLGPDGAITRRWSLCTVEQVEDLKFLVRLIPIWTSNFGLGTATVAQNTLTFLQARTMDRHIRHFQIPPQSVFVLSLIANTLFLAFFTYFIRPFWRKLRGKSARSLQLIGIGHVLIVASMAVSALVESKHRGISTEHMPMSFSWLLPQMVLLGIGESFHLPERMDFYYKEFPKSLRSFSSAMVGLSIGVSSFLGTALISLLRRHTSWFPNDIDNIGKLHYIYWVLVVIGSINFCYYLVCTRLYKYRPTTEDE